MLVLVLTALSAFFAQAQSPDQPSDHSKEAFVVEQTRTTYRFETDGTGRRENVARIKVQSDAGVQYWGQLAFGYNAANERLDIKYVRVRKADGNVVTASADAVQDLTSPVQREAPVYTDYRQKHVTVPGLRPGEILEYSVVTTIHTAHAPGHFWVEYPLERNVIVLDEQLEVDVPASRAVILKTEPGADAKITESAGRRIYRWTSSHTVREKKDQKKTSDDEEEKDPDEDDAPKRASVRMTTFQSWDEVGRWYSSLEKGSRTLTPEIRKKAEELVAGRKTDLEKIEALYNFVAPNFRYVSLSLGSGRYQPRAAADVLRDQYGDCKDKHTLLAAMLESIGIQASTVLINSAIKVDPDFPSPSQFDHAITRVSAGGQDHWMDVTTEVAPFRLLSANLRRKEALVIAAGTPARLIESPADPPVPSRLVQEVRGSLGEAGTFTGKVTLRMRGDVELLLRVVFRRTPAAMWKNVVEQMNEAGGIGGEVSNWKVSDPAATGEPFEIQYDVKKVGLVDWTKKKVDFALPWAELNIPQPRTDTKKPIELGAPGQAIYSLRLELGAGYQARPPLPVAVKRDYADYTADYKLDGRVFVADRALQVRTSRVPADRAGDVASFARVVASDDAQKLGLDIAPSVGAASVDLKAPDLIRTGFEALGNQNFPQAITLLKRALELEPKNKQAWSYLGSAYAGNREYDAAIGAFNKLLEVSPYDEHAWNSIAHVRGLQGKYEEAEAAFRKQLDTNPLDRYAHRGLARVLIETKRYSDAVPQLTKAISLTSDDSALYVDLGTAHLHQSNDTEALASFSKAIELSPTPNTWNNIAYQLSLKGSHLDRALQYAESAVSATVAASRNLTLDHVTTRELDIVQSLASYWDTLGWVYFARGDYKRAEGLVSASWFLGQHAEVGDHLAQVFEKTGRKNDAVRTYAAAVSAERPSPEIRTRLAAIAGASKVEELTRSNAPMLERARTFKVDATPGLKGSAEVALLLDSSSTPRTVLFIEGSEALRPLTDALKRLQIGPPLPDATAKVIRRGTLNCDGSGCMLKLVPAGHARPIH